MQKAPLGDKNSNLVCQVLLQQREILKIFWWYSLAAYFSFLPMVHGIPTPFPSPHFSSPITIQPRERNCALLPLQLCSYLLLLAIEFVTKTVGLI